MHVGLGRQLKEAKAILAEEHVAIDCSPPFGEELPKENFLEVVLLAALDVRKCQGCKGEILRMKCLPHPKRFDVSNAGTANMEGPKISRMVPTLWQCLFSLDHVMCKEAQQRHDH